MKPTLIKLPDDFFKELADLLYKPKVRDEKPYEMSWYELKDYPLDNARDKVELKNFPQGDYLYVFALAEATASIQIDQLDAPVISLTLDDKFDFSLHNPLHKLFLTNTAQADKTLIFLVSKGLFKFSRK